MTSSKRLFGTWAIATVLLVSLASTNALAAIAKPTNLTATALSSGQIQLTWQQSNSTNVESFTVKFAKNSTFTEAENVRVDGGNTRSYTHQPLQPSTKYWYKIRADGSSEKSAWSVVASATTAALEGTSISPLFFGLNAWMPYEVGLDVRNGRLEGKLCGLSYADGDTEICSHAEIYESGAKSMRYGGITVNENYVTANENYVTALDLSFDQYLTMVKNMKANDITPILQVPYDPDADDPDRTEPTTPLTHNEAATQAADLVRYINITNGMGVKYWTIGNEPDHEYNLPASEIEDYFITISRAMKEADSTILIIGPDLASYAYDDPSSILGLLTNCTGGENSEESLTGYFTGSSDGKLYSYLDFVSFHNYPFDGSQTREEVISYPVSKFEKKLDALQSNLNACNTTHGRGQSAHPFLPLLKMAVTEINVNTKNPVTNNRAGVGNASFLAGQFWAEIMSIGMKKGLEFISFWSAIDRTYGSIIHDGTLNVDIKLPTYYHFQMLAKHFGGVYASGTTLVYPSSLDDPLKPKVKAFGSKDVGQDRIAVMILNQKTQTSFDYTVRLNLDPIPGDKPLGININAGVNVEYSSPVGEPIGPQSTVLLIFNANGVFQNRTVYSLDGHARSDHSPDVMLY